MPERFNIFNLIEERVGEVKEWWDRGMDWWGRPHFRVQAPGPDLIIFDKETQSVAFKTCRWQRINRTKGGGMKTPKIFLMCGHPGDVTPYYCQIPPGEGSSYRGHCEASTKKMAGECLRKLSREKGRGENQRGRQPFIITLPRP